MIYHAKSAWDSVFVADIVGQSAKWFFEEIVGKWLEDGCDVMSKDVLDVEQQIIQGDCSIDNPPQPIKAQPNT